MKFFLSISAAVIICAVIMTLLPTSDDGMIYDNMIRLHVIAASDSEEDQSLKLKVRDTVLECIGDKIEGTTKKSDAQEKIVTMTGEIEACAEETIRDLGSNYDVSVVLGTEEYPERTYENFRLPAGEYTSLRVIIGEGEGKNWWCVLFPPLCTGSATKEEDEEDFLAAGFTGEQYELIQNDASPKYKVKFKILEIFENIFGTSES